VGDEDDRVALLLEVDELFEELGRLLGRQHGGRLVEDEDLRAAHEGLEDLDLLLHADRDVHDLGLRLDVKIVLFGILLRDLDGLGVVDEEPRLAGHHAQHHVLGDRETRHQHEVLVHHADPVRDGHGRRGETELFAADDDFAAGRLLKSEEHFHERGFAGAVFAHERVDLALAEIEVHALIGGDAVGIDLGDAFHLDDILLVPPGTLFLWHAC